MDFPVWEFTNEDQVSETMLRPVEELPVSSLSGRLIGTFVRLANGNRVPAILANVVLDNPRYNEQIITLSVFSDTGLFELARYFDPWYSRDSPSALAKFLGLDVLEIFPIDYDISAFCIGDPASVKGSFLLEPRERLTSAEVFSLRKKRS